MRLAIRHVTHYRFDQPVAHGLQRLRMRPKSTHGQQVIDWHMDLVGARIEVEYEDQNQNATSLASVLPGTQEVSITCSGHVSTADNAGIIGPHSSHMPMWIFLNQTPLTRPGVRMRALVSSFGMDRVDTLEALHALSCAVLDAVRYEVGRTSAETTGEEAAAAGHGVCQDHAHIFIGCARAMNVPARYVSGYLMMNDRIDQEAGHGWAEAHVDGLGWVGFDVANGISPDARYVRVATGCDYREAAPVTGISLGAGDSTLSVSLEVEQKLAEQ
jgi:transglutaminase-like putative cysteine protease